MSILRGHCRPFLISIACGLVLVCSQATWAQQAGANKDSQSNADSAPSAIEKLAKMLIGNWDVVATIEPNATRKGRKDTGANRIVRGPGGRSVIENYYTDGDSGSRSALGVLWWDDKVPGYRTMFCDNADPSGCSVYDGLGKWEGNDLVFRFKRDGDGMRIDGKELFTSISPSSFTVQFFESRNGGSEDATWTARNTKAQ
jgi:hypothetical protein